MSKDERVANALRVMVGELARPITVYWWHAYGRVREFERADGKPADVVYQLTVIGAATGGPDEARAMSPSEHWGTYLASWTHEPSNREKEAVTPEEFRQTEEELALWDVLEPADDDEL